VIRHRLLTLGVFLLVLTIVVVGLGACSRSAEERESTEATPAGTSVSGGSSGEELAPGETVVSAVTPVAETPSSGAQTTPGAEVPSTSVPGETPGAVETVPTTGVQATAVPPATQAPSSGGQTGTVWHTVQRGETTYSIARRYGTTVQAIAQANSLVNPSQIYAGQKLKIPTTGSSSGGTSGGTSGCRVRHTVQRGEWVWQIARNYGVSPYDILAANGLTVQTANTIYAGTVLCIP
jgi:LysM repeat protein